MTREAESGTDLWRVIASPVIWAGHFLACYVPAAVYCAKLGVGASLDPIRWFVLGITLAALAAIGFVVYATWQVWGASLDGDLVYQQNEIEERHRFLSHMTLMLSALSAAAVVFVSLPAVFITGCR